MAVKVAVWPGTSVVEVPVVQAPAGVARLTQVGPLVRLPAGAVWVSVIPTVVSVTLPVFLAMNW